MSWRRFLSQSKKERRTGLLYSDGRGQFGVLVIVIPLTPQLVRTLHHQVDDSRRNIAQEQPTIRDPASINRDVPSVGLN